MVRVCALNGIGFVVVPVYVLKTYVGIGFIAGSDYVGEVCHGALVVVVGIVIFDERAFAFEVFIFRAFFFNQIHFA